MAKIKLVVFDMDGTLLKPRSCWAYIHEHFGTDNSEMLEKYIEHKISDQEFVKSDISLWQEKSNKKDPIGRALLRQNSPSLSLTHHTSYLYCIAVK